MSVDIVEIGALVISAGVFVGYFNTKTPGFGRYTVSLLIIMIVLFVTLIAVLKDAADPNLLSNVLFAVIGFAAGFTANKEART